MKHFRPHRFPSLVGLAPGRVQPGAGSELSASLADGFQQGTERGYREGHAAGLERGHEEGLRVGKEDGFRLGTEEGRQVALAQFESLAAPLDAMHEALARVQADYQAALRQEVVELVGKVARQVIRCELALQPVQVLALVDETLATMPPATQGIEVFLNPEELQRIRELDPERAARWTLVADPRLEPGECRVKADGREADAGCRQRLAACMEQVATQLLPAADEELAA